MRHFQVLVVTTLSLATIVLAQSADSASSGPGPKNIPADAHQALGADSAKPPVNLVLPGATTPVPAAPTPTQVGHRLLNVAVLPFTGNSAVEKEELAAITSRFESELMATGMFRVLERRNVDAILREQGFQQSGACNTNDCQVEVGQLLGVERIVTGDVTRLDKLWSLTSRMVDVGTGAVAGSHVLDIKGKLETVLRGGCPEMAEILSGKKKPTSSRTVLTEEKTGVNPWVWVAGGTVVAGSAVAAVLLLTQNDGNGTPAAAPPRRVDLTLETGR